MEFNSNSKELEAKFATYSPEELLSNGRRFTEEGDYSQAIIAFEELSKRRDSKLKELSELYDNLLIFSAMYGEIRGIQEKITSEIIDRVLERRSIETMFSEMINSVSLHQEGKISGEDLMIIEKVIDRFPFSKVTITGREEFNKIYGRFKEYALKVFLEDKETRM